MSEDMRALRETKPNWHRGGVDVKRSQKQKILAFHLTLAYPLGSAVTWAILPSHNEATF